MKIRFKLYGVFRTAAQTEALVVDIKGGNPTVRSAISELISHEDLVGLKRLLIEEGTVDPRPNALVMLSGREINTLKGLETEITENDEIELLPIAHGG